MKVFRKNFPRNPIRTSVGKVIAFEDINGMGFLKTEDAALISELEAMMKAERGGVYVSSQEEYEAATLKKKPSSPRSSPFLNEVQTSGLITLHLPPPAPEVVPVIVAVPDVGSPAAVIPSETFVPAIKTGKRAK